MSSFIYGNLSDFVDDKYKKDISDIENVQKELFEHAVEFNFDKNLENF